MAKFEDYLFTKNTRWLLWGLVVMLLALLIFLAGISLGRRSGRHPVGFIPRGHGAVGTISAVGTSTFTLQEVDGETEEVTLASTTIIKDAQGSPASLAAGKHVVVLGTPSDALLGETGLIDAKFIRILQ